MDIRIKANLKAYTKGVIPTKVSDLEQDVDYVLDVPEQDGKIYVRKRGEWVEAADYAKDSFEAGTGIEIVENPENHYKISAKEWSGTQEEFDALSSYKEGYTYYIDDEFVPETPEEPEEENNQNNETDNN